MTRGPGIALNGTTFAKMQSLLYTPVLSDILDDFGVRNHTMNQKISPLRSDMVVAGKAVTVLFRRVHEVPERPYDQMITLLDGLRRDDVLVIDGTSCPNTSLWGELFSTAARARGARGVIIDGFNRDSLKIIKLGFPVFSTGQLPHDYKGRAEVKAHNIPIRSGNATVHPGDVVFADVDGAVVIPREIAPQVIKKAFEKATKENVVRNELLKGETLRRAWKKYGVL